MKKNSILIIDDDDLFRMSVANSIKSEKKLDIMVYEAKVGEEAFNIVKENPGIRCILLDYNFEKWGGPGQMNGLEIAEILKESSPHIPIIMTSEVGDRGDIAMKAAGKYVNEFLDKPFSKEKLLQKIRSYFTVESHENENQRFKEACRILNDKGFICNSPAMAQVAFDAVIASRNDWNVLILGETGTGKTILATIIHELSSRNKEPIKDMNCAGFAPLVIESELFGHVKGSFTGASDAKKGIFELAGNGTIFLDEIAELSNDIQAKLLYAIGEQRSFYKVGDPKNPIQNNARIIAATLKDPFTSGEETILRKDLIARFTKIIRIPPLRDRKTDLPDLIRYLLFKIDDRTEIEQEGVNLLARQPWIRNIHQLKSVLQNILANISYSNQTTITVKDVQEELKREYGLTSKEETVTIKSLSEKLAGVLIERKDEFVGKRTSGGLKSFLSVLENEIIQKALDLSGGNILQAARLIGENKDTFRFHLR